MKKNMGPADKIIRVLIAAVIAIFYFSGHINGNAAIVLGIIAIVFLTTSLIGYCPLYSPFGISSRKNTKQ